MFGHIVKVMQLCSLHIALFAVEVSFVQDSCLTGFLQKD